MHREEQRAFDKLFKQLDRDPVGIPDSPYTMAILRTLFTAEEAEIASYLSLRPRTVDELAVKMGIAADELAKKLSVMADKAVVYEIRFQGIPLYSLMPFYTGLFMNRGGKGITKDMADAWEGLAPLLLNLQLEVTAGGYPGARAVPYEQALATLAEPHRSNIVPYHKVSELLKEATAISILDCTCRTQRKLVGHRCKYPIDSMCLAFGAQAEFLNAKGIGQKATVEDALMVVKRAEDAGLVHQTSNLQHNIGWLCNCCSCCCSTLTVTALEGGHNNWAKTEYCATNDKDLCNGCEACVTVCHVRAISMEDGRAVPSRALCIGCGICVQECPTEALTMTHKEQHERIDMPVNDPLDWVTRIAKVRGRMDFIPEIAELAGH